MLLVFISAVLMLFAPLLFLRSRLQNEIAPQTLSDFGIQFENYFITDITVRLLMRGGSHLLIPQDLIIFD